MIIFHCSLCNSVGVCIHLGVGVYNDLSLIVTVLLSILLEEICTNPFISVRDFQRLYYILCL
jgi:hypothetical protein